MSELSPEMMRILAQFDTEAIEHAAEKALAEQSLLEFVKLMWSTVEPVRPFAYGWHIEAMCEHLEAITSGDITRLLINVPPGFMKALDCDTPVMTTWGWRRHGDLRPGDFVFGPDGKPKRVLAITPPALEESFEVVFDDNAKIVAGRGHLWKVERDKSYEAPKWKRVRKETIVTTNELIKHVPGNTKTLVRPDRIPLCDPIEFPPRRFLIDPYLLGVWLGDGATDGGTLYAAEQDVHHFGKLGRIAHTVVMEGKQDFHHIRVEGLQTNLRIMGLLGNKHIPDDYLESSIDQRLELLKGLMDTDGSCSKFGTCSYTTKLEHLSDQIMRLLSSLGLKPTVKRDYQKLNGKLYGPYWFISFTPPQGMSVFKLERKQARVIGNQNARSRGRYVNELTPVGERLVNCITVEGEMYLAGYNLVATHNSLLTNVFWPAWEWGAKNRPSLRYVCASYSQALTVRDNGRFRNVILADKYRTLWGDRFGPSRDQFSVVTVGNDKTGWKLATSVGGVGTGARGDRVIIDDPNSIKEAESELIRASTNQWFREVIPTRVNDPSKSAIVAIQQRTNEDDVSGVILADDLGYEHLCIPMEYDPGRHCVTVIGWEDPRGADEETRWENSGELAWPEVYPKSVVEKLKSGIGPYAASGQFNQAPTPRGGGIFKRDWWQPWPPDGYPMDDTKPMTFPPFEFVVAALDTAYTEKEENDPSALTIWGVWRSSGQATAPSRIEMDHSGVYRLADDERAKIMLVYGWQKRLVTHGPDEPEDLKIAPVYCHDCQTPAGYAHKPLCPTYRDLRKHNWGVVEWVIDSCRRYKVDVLLIEAKATGITVAQELARLYSNENFSTQLVNPRGDKVARAYQVQHLFSNKQVYAPMDSEGRPLKTWTDEIITQMASFPKAAHDDLTDTATAALQWLRDSGFALRTDEADINYQESLTFRPNSKPLYDV